MRFDHRCVEGADRIVRFSSFLLSLSLLPQTAPPETVKHLEGGGAQARSKAVTRLHLRPEPGKRSGGDVGGDPVRPGGLQDHPPLLLRRRRRFLPRRPRLFPLRPLLRRRLQVNPFTDSFHFSSLLPRWIKRRETLLMHPSAPIPLPGSRSSMPADASSASASPTPTPESASTSMSSSSPRGQLAGLAVVLVVIFDISVLVF